MKKVLITGGAGFIGSNLGLKLKTRGYEVTVLDNLSPQIHGTSGDSYLYRSIQDKLRFIKGDVTDRKDWEKALEGQQVVVHLAAETGTGQSMYEISKYMDVNVGGTGIMLDILANTPHSVEKVVVASSRAIYGEGKYWSPEAGKYVYPESRSEEAMKKGIFDPLCPITGGALEIVPTDEDSRIHPSSIYGLTKYNQEQAVMITCSSIGIPAVSFRPQNVYGPGQSLKNPYTGILSIFSNRIRGGKEVNIFEDGKESRDFIFIDDLVEAFILGIESPRADNRCFNAGSGVQTTVMQVARELIRCYGREVPLVVTGQYRLGDIRHNYADLSRIRERLGFDPKVGFEEGLKRFTEWVLEQEVEEDRYEASLREMKEKGLLK